MSESSQDFVHARFSEFYRSPSLEISPPASVGQREFGFLLFKDRVMLRHRGFASITSLKSFLSETVPSDVYYSCAYYENPESEMAKKGWLGADLIFDIDADHIPTSCNKIHDEWTCANSKCGFSGKGVTPESCPVCEGQKFETKTWPCELCLSSAKAETAKLIDMLEKDFGFSNKELHVFFSGHRGYHVQIENEAAWTLDTVARKEIADYVSGTGLAVLGEAAKRKSERMRAPLVFGLHDFGWNKRLKLGMQKFILNADKEDFRRIGVRSYAALLRSKDAVLKRCLEEGRWDSVRGVSVETWAKIAELVKTLESAKIDSVVTTDIHRLIRLAGSLHGKTGLKKVELPVSHLTGFDPFKEAVAFKDGAVEVFVFDAPEFRLGGKVFGPYRSQTVELPTAAAVLLVCKGRAEVVK